MLEARRLNESGWAKKVIDYVVNRQTEDGGYAFAQGSFESSCHDTYYGLAILKELDAGFPNTEKTLRFLEESRLDSIYALYYVTKARLLLGKGITAELTKHAASMLNSEKYFGSAKFFSEIPSEFITTHMALELANLLKIEVNSQEVFDWIGSFKNRDGGFGIRGSSNINSTYYATASIRLLKGKPEKLNDTVQYIRSCEKPYGGFTVIPINFMPYVEHTYFGVFTLDLLGEKCSYPQRTIDFLLQCQNSNGGFARSDLGISTFESTFQAISILKNLNGY
jgi:hypothetical protein